ncbi:hypothetical protein EAF04_006636 [Stromatinia cepivora]|nr:hypothetical protein EAF04_006636 [Stromatinia cepivora]
MFIACADPFTVALIQLFLVLFHPSSGCLVVYGAQDPSTRRELIAAFNLEEAPPDNRKTSPNNEKMQEKQTFLFLKSI